MRWFRMRPMPLWCGASANISTVGLLMRSRRDFLRRSKHNPSSWPITSLKRGLPRGPLSISERLRATPSNVQPMRRPSGTERARLALGLEVMLGQAMIADRGYAAPDTRKILLRAKTRFDDLTDPSQKFAILYGIWAGHYVGGEGSKQRDAAIEFLAQAERHKDTAA